MLTIECEKQLMFNLISSTRGYGTLVRAMGGTWGCAAVLADQDTNHMEIKHISQIIWV